MDRQGPPNRPCYQLIRGLNRLRQQKRCYDVTLSRQEVCCTTWRMHSETGQLVETQHDFSCHLVGWSVPTGLAIVHWIGYYFVIVVPGAIRAAARA